MATNWYNQTLPADPASSRVIPPAIRAKLLADQLVMSQAASTDAPVYSPAVGWAKIAAGALGGILHGKELTDLQNRQAQSMASAIPAYPGDTAQQPAPAQDAAQTSPTPSPSQSSAADDAPAAAASSAPPASPPSGYTPPAMSAPQLASILDPSKGWADPGSVPTIGAPVPGLSPGAPPPPDSSAAAPAPSYGPVSSGPTPAPMPSGASTTAGLGAPMPSGAAPISSGPTPGAPSAPTAGSPSSLPTMAVSPPPWPQPSAASAPSAPPVSQPASATAAQAATPSDVIRGTPMDRATYDRYAKMAQDPYLPAEYQQQAMQMLLPHQIPRSDGSIIMYDPIRGVGQQIVGPTGKWSFDRFGNRAINETTGDVRSTAAPGAAPGQISTVKGPDGNDYQQMPDGSYKVLETPDYQGRVEQAKNAAKLDSEDIENSRKNLEALRESGQNLQEAQSALAQYGGKLPTGPLGEWALGARGVANQLGLGDPEQLRKLEQFNKASIGYVSNGLRAKFGSRVSNFDYASTLKANPGIGVSDAGNRVLFDYAGRANRLQQSYETVKQQYYEDHQTLTGFQKAWNDSIVGTHAFPLTSYPDKIFVDKNGTRIGRVPSTDTGGYSYYPLAQQKPVPGQPPDNRIVDQWAGQ